MTAPGVPEPTIRRIVQLATRAPSVHNTQPWHWRATPHSLELYADTSRQLSEADPDGRDLVISCGAALHHAGVAADALGWRATLTSFPDPGQPDLLAHLGLSPGIPSRHAEQLVDAIERRCTDRRRFTSWPVPDERLTHLAAHATAFGALALPLSDVSERFWAEILIKRAIDRQLVDPPVLKEQQLWIDHARDDGVPSAVLPAQLELAVQRPNRFGPGLLDDVAGREVESSDGLIVLCAPNDNSAAWLTAGQGIAAMWLAATVDGLSMVPLSQVVEVPETRDALRSEVLGGLANPLIVVRVGWQAISRSQLARTPRRPVDEVLDLS